jgi:predicted dehydrogenase
VLIREEGEVVAKRGTAIIGSDEGIQRAWSRCPETEIVPLDSAEFVHVSLLPADREGLVKKNLEEGRSVLCRAPIASTPDEIRDLAAVAQKTGAKLRPFYPARFSPRYREVRSYVEQGFLGEPCILRLEWLFSRENGGPFTGLPPEDVDLLDDLVLQQIDLARWIVGGDVSRVKGQTASVRSEDDHAHIVLNFAAGALAFLECSLAADPAASPAGYLDVKGTKGIVTDRPLDGFGPVLSVYGGADGRQVRLTPEHPLWPADTGKDVGFLLHVLDFCGVPHGERRPEAASPQDDAANLRALEAVRKSLESGSAVEVPS